MKKYLLLLSGLLFLIAACNSDNQSKEKETKPETKEVAKPAFNHKAYKMKGMLIAKSVFKIFKAKIQAVGSKDGLPAVVDFCNENANKLADSIGKAHKVAIKRTSNRFRNEKNKPNADQQAVIDNYLRLQEDPNRQMEPIVMKDGEGFVHFYAPIKLKKECLKCHGKPGDEIKEPILEKIKKYYPNDKATGFSEGELRGIWDIKFLDKK